MFDPRGHDDVVTALRVLGVQARTEQLGSALMAAANERRIAGVVVAPDADEELRQLFMRAFRARHPSLPVVYLSPQAAAPDVVSALKEEGATEVLAWPLPAAEQVTPLFERLFPAALSTSPPAEAPFDGAYAQAGEAAPVETLPASALSPVGVDAQGDKTPAVPTRVPDLPDEERATSVPDDEASVLRRKLGDLESARPGPGEAAPAEALERAVREAKKKSAENTELRGELTVIRDRNAQLEERVQRLKAELEQLTRERDQLLHDEPSAPTTAFEELRGGVESYTHAMASAVDFLEDLQHRVGHRAPSLDAHVRTLKLVHQLLRRLQREAGPGRDR